MKAFLSISLCVISCSLFAQEQYSKVKIYAPEDTYKQAELIGLLQIDHFNVHQDGGMIAEISKRDIEKLKTTPYKFEVLVPDIAKQLDSLNRIYYASIKPDVMDIQSRVAFEQPGSEVNTIIATPSAFQVKPTFGGYYSFAEMNTAMNTLVATYPAITQKISLGKTFENRDIWCIKISDNVATDEPNEPEVLYMGLQHAREAITGASMIFFMQYLAERYALDTRIKNLVDNREIYIIPCFNPDGWEYNRTSQGGQPGGSWRKNRVANTGGSFGVDLNRNWGIDWGNCTAPIQGPASSCGSATRTSDTYWGTSAFSELETQAVRTFTKSRHIVAGFDQHAFGPYYSLPFGRQILHSMPQKGQNFYTAIPALMGTYNGMRAADSYDALGYEVAGGFKDWMLMGELGTSIGSGLKDTVWAMTGEGGAGGGGTHANIVANGTESFWAPASQIIELCKGKCYQNLQLAYAAGTYVDIQDANDIALTSLTGNLSFRIKRLGLGNAPVKITLVPLENFQSVGAPVTVSSMSYYDTYTGNVSYTLLNLPLGQRLRYAWKIETEGYIYSDTITRFYRPTELLFDDMEGAFATNWTSTSNVADKWAFTTLAAYSGSRSMTESPAGNYTSNTTRTVFYNGTLELGTATAAYLTFWTKHRAENLRDKLQVQVSTNGTTWVAIPGSTTIREGGTLDGATINGIPALTGIRDYWTQAIFDLSAYNGTAALRLRFVFTSDNDPSTFKFERDDGFYIDNVKVIRTTTVLAPLPVRFLNFTANLLPNKTVGLYWQAATTQEHDYFIVERSSDGINFTSLGRGPQFAPYHFIDPQPNQRNNYYRIRQVDKDGTVTYSRIITIFIKPEYSVAISPNPVIDLLTVKVATLQPEPITIRITDMVGREVYHKKHNFNSPVAEVKINMRQWSSQMYIVRLVNSENKLISLQKIIKK